jgi:hypothetical protein
LSKDVTGIGFMIRFFIDIDSDSGASSRMKKPSPVIGDSSTGKGNCSIRAANKYIH